MTDHEYDAHQRMVEILVARLTRLMAENELLKRRLKRMEDGDVERAGLERPGRSG